MCSKLDQERIKGPLSPLRWSRLKQPSLAGASVAGHVASLWSPHLIKSGFWYAENFCHGIQNPEKICWWNPESWALDSGIQLKESRGSQMIRIRNPRHRGEKEHTNVCDLRNDKELTPRL